jgi:hypothetical protein
LTSKKKYFNRQTSYEHELERIVHMPLNGKLRYRIAHHTKSAAKQNTPLTPIRYNKKEIMARATIMNIKHSIMATIATKKPTPLAISRTISPNIPKEVPNKKT